MTTFIYTLSSVDDLENIRYVGKTKNLKKRFTKHKLDVEEGKTTHKANWMRSVNCQVAIVPILVCEDHDGSTYERILIKGYRDLGFDLTNATAGGEGFTSEDAKAVWADRTEDERKALGRRSRAALTPAGAINRSVKVSKAKTEWWSTRTDKDLKELKSTMSEAAVKRMARYSTTERQEQVAKGLATKAKNGTTSTWTSMTPEARQLRIQRRLNTLALKKALTNLEK